jgi:hypothetical protein
MAELNCVIEKTFGTLDLYYRYEETSGSVVADTSNYSNTGTASRTNILNNTGGKFGNKAVFVAASSDNIFFGTAIKPTGPFSVGSWVNATTNGTPYGVMQITSQNPNEAGFRCEISSTGVLNFSLGNNTGNAGTSLPVANSTGTVTDGNWHLVGYTYDGTTMRNWINGTIDGTGTVTAGFNPAYAASPTARVGCVNFSGSNVRFFNGSMDDTFMFIGTALGSSSWTKLYSGGCDISQIMTGEI